MKYYRSTNIMLSTTISLLFVCLIGYAGFCQELPLLRLSIRVFLLIEQYAYSAIKLTD